MVDSKILDAAPITEREYALLMAARDAESALQGLHVYHLKEFGGTCSDCNNLLGQLRAALVLYRDRP